jgi:hypothetical protein
VQKDGHEQFPRTAMQRALSLRGDWLPPAKSVNIARMLNCGLIESHQSVEELSEREPQDLIFSPRFRALFPSHPAAKDELETFRRDLGDAERHPAEEPHQALRKRLDSCGADTESLSSVLLHSRRGFPVPEISVATK